MKISHIAATDYHGNQTTFTVGMDVMHVTDDGQIYPGTIATIDQDLIEIKFPDGEKGWERPATCYPG